MELSKSRAAMGRKKIIIVGAGPAGLMAADVLSEAHDVLIFEKEKTIGRKFLVAGKGGFNLTNKAEGEELIHKYSSVGFLDEALLAFDSRRVRAWLATFGIPTYIGTSGRVFPEEGIKPSEVLTKLKTKLLSQGVEFRLQHEFLTFDSGNKICFHHQDKQITEQADAIIFALGGASWPKTGSNGSWASTFEQMGVKLRSFQASNCGLTLAWPAEFKVHHAGKPLKNIRLFTDTFEIKGEALISDYGLEGNAIYPMVRYVREKLNAHVPAYIYVDFKPMNSEEELLQKIKGKQVKPKDYAQLFKLNTLQLALLKNFTTKESYLSPHLFVGQLKKLPLLVTSLRPIEEAISTVGGVCIEELNADFSLKKYPWVYTVGEMIDWDAPTGGYLLQGCFSSGYFAAISLLNRF